MGIFQPYETNEALTGEAKQALDFAAKILGEAAFQIDAQTETLLRASALRTDVRSINRSKALLPNVMTIELRVIGRRLTARGELADYPVLQKALGLVFGALLFGAFYYYELRGPSQVAAQFRWGLLIFAGIWIGIGILEAVYGVKGFQKRAWASVDRLVHNIAMECQDAKMP